MNDILKLIIEEDRPVLSVVRHEMKDSREDYNDTMITDWAHIKGEIYYTDIFTRIIYYLLRIYYWSDLVSGLLDHWTTQIYLFYHDIPKQKGRKNRYPSKKVIYKKICNIFEDYEILNSDIKRHIRGLPGYKELPDFIIDQKAIDFCKKYIDWICEKLSTYGKVEEYEVKEIINKLMEEK